MSSLRSDVILSYWTLSSTLGIATVRRQAPGTALSWLGSARCEVTPNLCSPHPEVSQPSAAWLSQGVADRVPNPAQSQTAASEATLDIQSCYFSLTRGSLHLRWNEFQLTSLLAAGRQFSMARTAWTLHTCPLLSPREPGGHEQLCPHPDLCPHLDRDIAPFPAHSPCFCCEGV